MPHVNTQRRERFEKLVLQTDRHWTTQDFRLNDDGEYMYEDLREWWAWFEHGWREAADKADGGKE